MSSPLEGLSSSITPSGCGIYPRAARGGRRRRSVRHQRGVGGLLIDAPTQPRCETRCAQTFMYEIPRKNCISARAFTLQAKVVAPRDRDAQVLAYRLGQRPQRSNVAV